MVAQSKEPPAGDHIKAKKVSWGAGHYHTLGALFLCYAVGMFGKGTMSLSIFGMSKDAALGFSPKDVASLLAQGSLAYTGGKLVGGPLSDLLGGRGTLVAMLTIMATAKLAMSRATTVGTMGALWMAARGAHALTWMGVMLVARPWFLGNGLESALPLLTASSRVGAFGGSIIGGSLLASGGAAGWQRVAQVTSLVTISTAALMLTLRNGPASSTSRSSSASSPSSATTKKKKGHTKSKLSFAAAMSIAMKEPRLWLVYGSTALITPTFDLTSLLPMYLDSLGMAAGQIGTLGSLFPVAAVPAVLIAGKLQQKLTPRQRQFLYAPLLGVSTAGMLVLSSLGRSAGTAIIAPTLIAIMVGVGPSLYVPNYDFVMRFGGQYTGAVWLDHHAAHNLCCR